MLQRRVHGLVFPMLKRQFMPALHGGLVLREAPLYRKATTSLKEFRLLSRIQPGSATADARVRKNKK